MNAGYFQRFIEQEYHFSQWAGIQKDTARREPKITAETIFKVIVYQVVLGIRSLLKLDQFSRTKPALWLTGSVRRMVASDTTMLRVLGKWAMKGLRRATYGIHLEMRQRGHASMILSSGRKVHLFAVDGTNVGGLWFSALACVGRVYHGVDCEPSKGRGHELKTSRTLLGRACRELGRGFASHILYDGLAADRIDFALARKKWRSHLVVKTQEETLEIIASSKEVWEKLTKQELKRAGVEIITGVDAKRGIRYEVYAQGGIIWEGLQYPLKLAWVKETHLKGKYQGQTLTFWGMTTDETLSASELREVAHDRWAIETNGFKELNEQVGSKKAHIKNQKAKEALMLMWFLGMALLKAFQNKLAEVKEWKELTVRKTKALIAQFILSTFLCEVAVHEASP